MSESTPRIDRRQILIGMGLTGLALATWPTSWLLATGSSATDIAAERIAALFNGRDGLDGLGQQYLRSAQGRVDPKDLVEEILPPSIGLRAFVDASDDEVRLLLSARVADDFVSHRITSVEGWILSRTEMKIAALVALRGI